jgi:hypothetical protein
MCKVTNHRYSFKVGSFYAKIKPEALYKLPSQSNEDYLQYGNYIHLSQYMNLLFIKQCKGQNQGIKCLFINYTK